MNSSRLLASSALLLLVLCSGCVGVGAGKLNNLARELARDPASCTVRVTTVYGTLTFTRTNPGSNTIAHSISADGTITVGEREP